MFSEDGRCSPAVMLKILSGTQISAIAFKPTSFHIKIITSKTKPNIIQCIYQLLVYIIYCLVLVCVLSGAYDGGLTPMEYPPSPADDAMSTDTDHVALACTAGLRTLCNDMGKSLTKHVFHKCITHAHNNE